MKAIKEPIIEFKNFGFQYRAQSIPTLFDINLTIYKGEKILIVGASGSGKSTLTHCLNGLVPFSYHGTMSGSLKIKGQETKDLSIFKISKSVGTVLQDPDSQFIGLTVAEDIAFKMENECITLPEMKETVEKAAKLVDIDRQLMSSPHQLSGGQKQRVTLAGVMTDDVDILIFDEPLANLDPATGKSAMELIDEIGHKTNKTIIIIEHRLEDVLHIQMDRIIVIGDGRIVADMTPDDLLSSDVLRSCGIREPLYLTAMRYAGCGITSAMNPAYLQNLQLGVGSEKLASWYSASKEEHHKRQDTPILEFQNVSFGYTKNKETLHDVSFQIQQGDMVSIVGRNGAGKSTISKLVCGFYPPTKGKILYKGRDIATDSIKERAEKIGMVMQNPNQMISKTMIFEEVAMGLIARGVQTAEIESRVHEVLKTCGLYEFRNWPISALSFGQKKRVTIAAILVLNPEVIILDEPTAGQDFKHYNEIMEFLLMLNEKGVTIVMITHDMHLMLEYTNNAIVLSEGTKLADELAAEVLTDDRLIEAANLKRTSLYDLAIKANLTNPKGFVGRFIDYDRRLRRQ